MTSAVGVPGAPAGTPALRRGGHTVRLATDLDTLDSRSLTELQARNLAATFAAVAAHPAARRHWFGGREPTSLRDLPLFSPDDLARHCPPGSTDLVLDSAESGLVLRSSGTTGRRKVLYHSWAFNDRVAALGTRGARAGRAGTRRVGSRSAWLRPSSTARSASPWTSSPGWAHRRTRRAVAWTATNCWR